MATTTLNLTSTEYRLKVQKGEITGTTIVEAYGEVDGMGTPTNGGDIWRGNELSPSGADLIPIPPDVGDLMSIVSESTDDTLLGTGVQKLNITYIDATGNEQTLSVDMNGTTPVDTGIQMRFIQTINATQLGANGVSEGHIKIYQTGDTSIVYNMIEQGGNMSLTTNRMVPLGKTLYLQEWDCSEGNNDRVFFRVRSTDFDGVIIPRVFIFKDSNMARSSATGQLRVSAVVPALSIVKVSGWPASAGAEATAGWWGYLVDD